MNIQDDIMFNSIIFTEMWNELDNRGNEFWLPQEKNGEF